MNDLVERLRKVTANSLLCREAADEIARLDQMLCEAEGERDDAWNHLEMCQKERDQARAVAQTLYREIRDQLANADSEAGWIDDQTPNAELRAAANNSPG